MLKFVEKNKLMYNARQKHSPQYMLNCQYVLKVSLHMLVLKLK